MPKIQLISCRINIGGDRNNVVVRGPDRPVTFPEALVLQALHGGSDHVHSLVDVGSEERDISEEFERLVLTYGGIVRSLFPSPGGRPSIPLGDENIPTLEAVTAARQAHQATLDEARSRRTRRSRPPIPPETAVEPLVS